MAIASNILVTEDGVPRPAIAEVATDDADESCHNGRYKNVYKSK